MRFVTNINMSYIDKFSENWAMRLTMFNFRKIVLLCVYKNSKIVWLFD